MNNGNTDAMYMTAFCLYKGRGVKQDYNKAYKIFSQLLNIDSSNDVLYMIAECYYYGRGVEQDYQKAFEMCNTLVGQGYETAKFLYAQCLYYGNGVKRDSEKAFVIFEDFASKDENDIEAKYMVGISYLDGFGVEQNYNKAFEILNNLVENYNDDDSKLCVAEMYMNGWGVEKNTDLALKYYKELAEKGYKDAEEKLKIFNQ